jgi:hypothetical protein
MGITYKEALITAEHAFRDKGRQMIRIRRGTADLPLGKPTAIKGWTPRPDRIDCMRHLRDFCQAQGAAYFLKQWGGIIPDSAGRILHGEWSEQPRVLGDNGRWHDRRGSVKRVHPPRSLVNTYSQLRPAGGAMMVTLEALSLEADASTASHPFASRRASRRLCDKSGPSGVRAISEALSPSVPILMRC